MNARSQPNVGQLVRWTDDTGATAYGRVQGVHADGEKALYAVKGREAGLVEQVEPVEFDDLEQVEAWLESGVD